MPAMADATGPTQISVMTFTALEVSESEAVTVEDALAAADRPGITWINVEGLGEPAVLTRLAERFAFHPLSVEDALSVAQRPKVERYDHYYFLVMRTARLTPELEEEQVSLFFGAGFVITIQERIGGDVFDPVRDAIRKDRGRIRTLGADFLAYSLLDAVCDGYFPVMEAIGERVDAVEDAAIARPIPAILVQIQRLRHDLLRLRRAVWPMRDVLATLQRESSELISDETKVFVRDAYDHAIQSLELTENYRETVAAVMEIYLSAQNQRLNEVMKVLTVIATLFIPLTFIASIYGMNFEFMPELGWRYGYAFALGLMAVVGAGLIFYFKNRGWW
jgi:magnesium transporter